MAFLIFPFIIPRYLGILWSDEIKMYLLFSVETNSISELDAIPTVKYVLGMLCFFRTCLIHYNCKFCCLLENTEMNIWPSFYDLNLKSIWTNAHSTSSPLLNCGFGGRQKDNSAKKSGAELLKILVASYHEFLMILVASHGTISY